MLRHIDIYCERTGPELWSEPLNAVTNVAFIIAGAWGLREARKSDAGPVVVILCWWVIVIGLGSGLFHTFANRLTMLADAIPIATFTLAYTAYAIHRFLGYGRLATAAILIGFFGAAGVLTSIVPESVNRMTGGSFGYLPAFLSLFVFGAWAAARKHPAGKWLLAGAFIFLASVMFRALDHHVCEFLPVGTHFMWHILNALMLGLLLIAAARHGGRKQIAAR